VAPAFGNITLESVDRKRKRGENSDSDSSMDLLSLEEEDSVDSTTANDLSRQFKSEGFSFLRDIKKEESIETEDKKENIVKTSFGHLMRNPLYHQDSSRSSSMSSSRASSPSTSGLTPSSRSASPEVQVVEVVQHEAEHYLVQAQTKMVDIRLRSCKVDTNGRYNIRHHKQCRVGVPQLPAFRVSHQLNNSKNTSCLLPTGSRVKEFQMFDSFGNFAPVTHIEESEAALYMSGVVQVEEKLTLLRKLGPVFGYRKRWTEDTKQLYYILTLEDETELEVRREDFTQRYREFLDLRITVNPHIVKSKSTEVRRESTDTAVVHHFDPLSVLDSLDVSEWMFRSQK